ncbi:hypothetical protein Tco_0612221 [Tanacetum coccineum]
MRVGNTRKLSLVLGGRVSCARCLQGVEFEVEPQRIIHLREQHLAWELSNYREDSDFQVEGWIKRRYGCPVRCVCAQQHVVEKQDDSHRLLLDIHAAEIWATKGLLNNAKGNVLGMEIFRDQSGNTLRVSQSRPIRRIHQGRYGVSVPALTKDHKRNEDQYAISRGLNTPYSRYGINIIFWKISNVVLTPRNPQYALNTAYPLPSDTAYPVLCPIQLRMTKVIKGEFEKIKDVKVEDVPLTCDAPLEVFNNEVSRLSGMDDDLFTYEVEVANIPCDSKMDDDSEQEADDDMGYDPSDVAFTEWLGSKIFNYKTMDHYTMKALWIYWIRGDDEVELTDEESSDDMDEVAEVFRIDTNLFNFETPMCKAFKEFNYLLQVDPDLLTKDIEGFKTYEDYKNDWIYEWNKDVPWVDEKPWTNAGVWTKPTPVKHTCKPFNYKTGCSEWPTCSWRDDGYCNGGNLPGTYIIGNQLHYQDYEWYEALEDSELKDLALRNKAIMEGVINEDDDESRYEQKRRWNIYTNYDDVYEINHGDNEREELCEIHELPVCNIRRYMMIKYSFNNDEEYVAVKEDEYDDFTITRKEAYRAYQ